MSIDYQIKYKNMANGRHEFQRWEKISEEKAMGMVKRHFGQLAAKNINDMQYYGSVLELPLCWIRARVEQSPFMSFNRGTDVEVWDGPRLVNPPVIFETLKTLYSSREYLQSFFGKDTGILTKVARDMLDKAKDKDATSICTHGFDRFGKPTYEEIKLDNMIFFETINKLRRQYLNRMYPQQGKYEN